MELDRRESHAIRRKINDSDIQIAKEDIYTVSTQLWMRATTIEDSRQKRQSIQRETSVQFYKQEYLWANLSYPNYTN